MKVYFIVEADVYGCKFSINKCFASKEKAEKFCHEHNKGTYNYLQNCDDNYEAPGNYILYEVIGIAVIEDE